MTSVPHVLPAILLVFSLFTPCSHFCPLLTVLPNPVTLLSSRTSHFLCALSLSPSLPSLSTPSLSPHHPVIYVILSIYISCRQFPCPFSNTIFNYFCFVSLLSTDAPILVYIHGGYWQELSRDQSAYCVVPQYQSGIRVIVVGYDLAPRGHFHYPSSCS